jgi:hypothetical protein
MQKGVPSIGPQEERIPTHHHPIPAFHAPVYLLTENPIQGSDGLESFGPVYQPGAGFSMGGKERPPDRHDSGYQEEHQQDLNQGCP